MARVKLDTDVDLGPVQGLRDELSRLRERAGAALEGMRRHARETGQAHERLEDELRDARRELERIRKAGKNAALDGAEAFDAWQKEVKAAERKLADVAKRARATGKVVTDTGDRGVAAWRKWAEAAGGVNHSLEILGKAYRGVSTVVGGVVSVGADLVESFQRQESAVASLDAALRAAGQEEHLQQYRDLATALQAASTAGDEELLPMIGRLATVGNVPADMMARASRAALDFAEGGGRSVPEAFNAIAKAGAGQYEVLNEIGLRFDRTGDRAADFRTALGLIEEKFGGMSEAATRTSAGGLKQLANQWRSLKEEGGELVAGAIAPIVARMREAVPQVQAFVGAHKADALAAMRAAGEGLADTLPRVIEQTKRAVSAWKDIAAVTAPARTAIADLGKSLNAATMDLVVDAIVNWDRDLDSAKESLLGLVSAEERAADAARAERMERGRQAAEVKRLARERLAAAKAADDQRAAELDASIAALKSAGVARETAAATENHAGAIVRMRGEMDAARRQYEEHASTMRQAAAQGAAAFKEWKEESQRLRAEFDSARERAEVFGVTVEDLDRKQRSLVEGLRIGRAAREQQARDISQRVEAVRTLSGVEEWNARIASQAAAAAQDFAAQTRGVGDAASAATAALNGQIVAMREFVAQSDVGTGGAEGTITEGNAAVARVRERLDAAIRQGGRGAGVPFLQEFREQLETGDIGGLQNVVAAAEQRARAARHVGSGGRGVTELEGIVGGLHDMLRSLLAAQRQVGAPASTSAPRAPGAPAGLDAGSAAVVSAIARLESRLAGLASRPAELTLAPGGERVLASAVNEANARGGGTGLR